MARIRTIKPEFFRHEDLFDAEQKTRLPLRVAYSGLWTIADREGRFRWRPRALKPDVLPYDAVDFEDVMNGLASIGVIVRYESGGESYGYIPSWKKHQVINQREAKSVLPAPSENTEPPGPGKGENMENMCMHMHAQGTHMHARGEREGNRKDLEDAKASSLSGKPDESPAENEKTNVVHLDNEKLKPWQNPNLTDKQRWDLAPYLYRADKVIGYLNEKTGSNFQARNPGGGETGTAKIVIHRIKAGWYWSDFLRVIDDRVKRWKGDEKMQEYLRPKTLFAAQNFENYVGQVKP